MPRGWSRDSLQSVPEPRRSHSVRSISEFRMRVESTWCPQTQSLFSKLSSLKRTANNGRANCPHKLTKAAGPLARRPSRLGRLELHARGTSAASSLLPLRVGRGSRRAAPSGRHVRRLLQLRVSTLGRRNCLSKGLPSSCAQAEAFHRQPSARTSNEGARSGPRGHKDLQRSLNYI